MFKILFALAGGSVGLTIAWAVRPSRWGYRPDLSDILSNEELQGDFILYGLVGLAVGLLIGAVIDVFRRKGDN